MERREECRAQERLHKKSCVRSPNTCALALAATNKNVPGGPSAPAPLASVSPLGHRSLGSAPHCVRSSGAVRDSAGMAELVLSSLTPGTCS